MARLNLNISIAEQKLLAENKERAADNQYSKEDSTRRKLTATEGTNPAPNPAASPAPATADQNRGGGVPESAPRRDPAAQRRKKKLRLFGIDRFQRLTDPGSDQIFSQQWTAYISNISFDQNNTSDQTQWELLSYALETEQRTNNYHFNSVYWSPATFEELKASRSYIIPEAYRVANHAQSVEWTLRQRSQSYSAFGIEAVDASPPALTFSFYDKRVASEDSFYRHVSSDGTHIYVSILIQLSRAAPEFHYAEPDHVFPIYNLISPELGFAYDHKFSGANSQGRREEKLTRRVSTAFFAVTNVGNLSLPNTQYNRTDVSFYGLYWKINKATGQSQLQTSQLSDPLFANFLDGLYSTDPHREHWSVYRQNASSPQAAANLYYNQELKYFSAGTTAISYFGWPPSLVYYPDSGLVTFVTRPPGADRPRVFTRKGTPGLTYHDYARFLLPSNYNPWLTTEQDFLNAGWKLDRVVTTPFTSDVEHYFAHRP